MFWLLPGGGREGAEAEVECVLREVQEETHLHVRVDRRLKDRPAWPGGMYHTLRTYLCTPLSGEAAPGFEPEDDAADAGQIVELHWISLSSTECWPDNLGDGPMYEHIIDIRRELGYQ